MEFQVISWDSNDINTDDGLVFHIHLFGRTKSGESVCCKTEFHPYFFIEVPEHWSSLNNLKIEELLKSNFPYYLKKDKNQILDISMVRRKKFFGFTNDQLFYFIRVTFKSKKAFSNAFYALKKTGYRDKLYEGNIDPILRFIHIQKLESTGWVKVSNFTSTIEDDIDSETCCVHEINVPSWRDINPLSNDETGPVITASFDIETYSEDGSFPDPESTSNYCPVIQIATTFQRYGEKEPFKRNLITLNKCDPIPNVDIIECKSERDLILSWVSLIQEDDPDIIVGYNIWKFDLSYMYKRANKLQIEDKFVLNRFKTQPSKLYSKKFSSSAYGENAYEMVESIGRMQIDLLELYKREHKLVKYSLDAVSEHFLGDKKVDMPIPEMFERFKRGTPEDMAAIGKYCVKDTELPLRLMQKLANLPNLIEMAKVTFVPMNYLIERGQQIKVFSQITRETRKENMLVKANVDEKSNESFVGATVLNAKKGAYMDKVVTGLDFASLYPSIMRAHNLCYNTIVLDKTYDNLPDIEYETVSWTTTDNNGTESNHRYKYAQNKPGILPIILENLAKSRKQAKKDMASAKKNKDEFMESVYNGKQLAYKVSMNSIYGFCAAFMLPCQPISASVTTIGRNMIEQTKTLVEKWYPESEVIYGDSVKGDTPLLLKNDHGVLFQRIDDLFNASKNIENGFGTAKEYANIENHDIYVWSDIGFTKIKRVMRHYTTKKIFRVLTHTGLVDVTEDHSLLLDNGSEIRPRDTTIGTHLLHNKPTFETNEVITVSIEEAKIMGFFFGDGSCGVYDCLSGKKNTWVLNNSNLAILEQLQAIAPFETKIYDTMNSSGVYKMNLIGDKLVEIVQRYRRLFYNENKEKIVPSCILNASIEILQSFYEGYYLADGDKDINGYNRFDCKGKQGTAGLLYVAQRLGYNTSINTRKDKPNIFRVTCSKSKSRRCTTSIKKIEEIGTTTDYVYDLETENHHFHVGPGNLIVHNTDSVMVIFDTKSTDSAGKLKESFKMGEEAADRISKTFKKPIELEFEKCYYPYLLFSKKRYAGLMYTNPEKPDYIDAKGITLVRRDNTTFVRNASKKILNMIMYDRQLYEAMNFVQNEARRLLRGDVEVGELILSKSLKSFSYVPGSRSSYLNGGMVYAGFNLLTAQHEFTQNVFDKKTNGHVTKTVTPPPHVYLAYKINQRKPGEGPKSGSRLPYVFVDTGNEKDLQYLKAEDPSYVIEHNLKLDRLYYLEHSLMKPVESLFELFIENPSEELFKEMINEYKLANGLTVKKTKAEKELERANKIVQIVYCKGLFKNGKPCTSKAKGDTEYCGRHS